MATLQSVTHIAAASRGATHIGWLDSKHSFSFGNYHEPARMGYHGLRVLNDDRVAPGQGFGAHPHRDMEILTWVLDGELAHRDSMGHASTLGRNGVQLMSAGTGVTHSEFNGASDAPVHFLQVWIEPRERGTTPRYQEKLDALPSDVGGFVPTATPDGRDGSLMIGADVQVFLASLPAAGEASLDMPPGRVAYVHVATGGVTVNGLAAGAGDAVTVEGGDVNVVGGGNGDARVIVFRLPA